MKKFATLITIALFLSGCSLIPGKKNQGALQVTSNLTASLFLNNNNIGQTPYYNDKLKAGEYTLKLVPGGGSDNNSFETKITISPGVLSVVSYQFAENPEESTSEILELEKLADKSKTELAISSIPDKASVYINGDMKGVTPIIFDNLSPNDYGITFELPGYKNKQINVKTNAGHRLTVRIQLARDNSIQDQDLIPELISQLSTPSASLASRSAVLSEVSISSSPKPSTSPKPNSSPSPNPIPSPSPKPTPTPSADGVISGSTLSATKPFVEILTATQGIDWLRVRSQPSSGVDNEVAKVRVGTTFPFIEKNEAGWIKIEYQPDKQGWISGKYGKIVE